MVVVVFQARPGIVKIFDVERNDCATVERGSGMDEARGTTDWE